MPTYTFKEAASDFEEYTKTRRMKYGKLRIDATFIRINDEIKKLLAERNLSSNLLDPAVQAQTKHFVREYVEKYSRDKRIMYSFCRDFASFLKSTKGIDIYPQGLDEYMQKYIDDPFEVQIAILKMLHGTSLTSSQISENLSISDVAVKKYLREMTSMAPNEGLRVRGEKIYIHFNKARKVYSAPNTIHPLLLTASARQVWTVLEGLYYTERGDHPEYSFEMAANIWGQLSDYCKDRIKAMRLKDELREQWIHRLETSTKPPAFQTEDLVNEILAGQNIADVDYFFKSQKKCDIEYLEGEEAKRLHNCMVVSHEGHSIYHIVDETQTGYKIQIEYISKICLHND